MHLVERRDAAVIIYVKDILDRAEAAKLASTITLAEEDKNARIIVSMERCKSCDSAGLAVLALAHRRIGSNFIVVLPDGAPCRRTFMVTGLSTLIHLAPSVQGALEVQLGAA
jgi:anti-anti-sigma factor